jgi:FixJ family two-component response regulator
MKRDQGTVLVVDDDPDVLRVLGRILEGAGYTAVLFGSAEALLDGLESPPASTACLVLDVRLPGLDGLAVQRLLVERKTILPIVFISAHASVPATVRAMKAGAVDFLLKPFGQAELLGAVRAALERCRDERARTAARNDARRRIRTLSPREAEVFRLVVGGMANKEIGKSLGITERTVKLHRGNLGRKLGCRTVVQFVRLAEAAGLPTGSLPG